MHWWQSAVLYQIYPRSFQDSNATASEICAAPRRGLPYLVELGADALWLSPIFASPMADFGYDISDYTAIDPLFGSMADFDALLAAAHGVWAQGAARSRAQPHLGPASVVRGKPGVPR